MSLLLDALKKAADDKKRSVDKALDEHKDVTNHTLHEEAETLDNEPVVDDSLELELSVETEQPESAQNDPQEFPAVAKSSASLASEDRPDLADNTVLADTDVISTDKDLPQKDIVTPKAAELVVPDESRVESQVESAGDSKHEKKQIHPSINQINSQTESVPDVADISTKSVTPPADLTLQSTKTAKHKYNKSIESEKALSALIDRSNQYNNKQNLKTKIYLAILFFLILTGSALYFYIKINTTTQELYISQNSDSVNNTDINNTTVKDTTQNKTAVQPEPVKQVPHNESQAVDNSPSALLTSDINKPASQPTSTHHAKPVATKTTTTNSSVANKTAQLKQTQEINIVHTKKSDPVHKLLQDAYAAFNRADFQTAETLYQQVIQRENRNRDAILGLSAIAIKQQRYEYARQKYQYLLHLDPKDSIATAGISLIENSLNPQLSESQLKFMLKEQPDAAHLYFALGSLYSSQNQWAEAQAAFFSAWSTENKNADFAYNLAVSLDHLAKHLQALNYYQLSLKLAQSGNVNFSIENTQQRIHFLQQAQP